MEQVPDHPVIRAIERNGYTKKLFTTCDSRASRSALIS